MSSKREWPHEHTEFVLDYIDASGHTLVTPGLRRTSGYEALRKLLNSKGIPRPRPPYSTEEINTHCLFLKDQYSAYQGPNLKSFFRNGRAYLSPPLGTAAPAVHDTWENAMSAIEIAARASVTPIYGTQSHCTTPPSQYTDRGIDNPQKQRNPKEVRHEKLTPLPHDIAASSVDSETINTSPRESIHSTLVPWQDLFYLRSEKCRIPIQAIQPAMIRLKRNIEKAVELYLENEDTSTLSQPDFEYIKQHHQDLAELLRNVVHEMNMAALVAGKISNATLLRSLTAWSAYTWVFQDPFPILGTEKGGIWDELKEMLKERGGSEIMDNFENLRLDLQFRLSKKSELIEQTLPARADELARKFASIVEPLFLSRDSSGQQEPQGTTKQQYSISDAWITTLRKTYLDALEINVQLRQREIVTEFTWPEPGAIFDDFRLQAENNGTKLDFEGKRVLLTLVPGAFSWIPSDDLQGEMEEIIYYKAAVFLDMDDNFES